MATTEKLRDWFLSYDNVLRKVLRDRELTIIKACFGIGEPEMGLEEIGDKLNLTRERVRRIREKSISKLRDSGNAKILMKYLGLGTRAHARTRII